MALLNSSSQKSEIFDDYCQPVDALKGLPQRTSVGRHSYRRISDKTMQQVKEASTKRSSTTEVHNFSEGSAHPPASMEGPSGPDNEVPKNPGPDYEEPWEFRVPFTRLPDPPPGVLIQTPRSVEDEYEDPWDSRARKKPPTMRPPPVPRDSSPPGPSNMPGQSNNENRFRSATMSGPPRSYRSAPLLMHEIDSNRPLEEQPWYHGTISRNQAEDILSCKPEFSFLVRKSETSKTSFSLSLKCSSQEDQLQYIHVKISLDPEVNDYVVGEFSKPFPTVPQAIKYYTQHKLRIRGADHRKLQFPVTRMPSN